MKFILSTILLITALASFNHHAYAYASLAIDTNQGNRLGYAWGYDNAYDADQRALVECGQSCRIVKNFSTGCGAYSADQSYGGTAYGWGVATTEKQAKDIALGYCKDEGGTECIIRVWTCNSN
jgi:hypothetical protein